MGSIRGESKAVSSIIGTILVLSITLALGGLLYAYSRGLFSSMTQNPSVNVQVELLSNPNALQTFIQYEVQNNGNVEITVQNITVLNSTHLASIAVNKVLEPGQTLSGVQQIPSYLQAGYYYTVAVYMSAQNGKQFSSIQNVLVTAS